MKKYYLISWEVDGSPIHLLKSVCIAIYVMEFINMFIGSMGGIAALIGFLTVYYLLKGMVLAGNRISHQLSMTSETEVRYLILNYGIVYLLFWFISKVILFVSRITGWGNVNGLSAGEYLRNLYGATMLERWAYFFTATLMFSFIISLFPLVVIKRPRKWFAYFILDNVFFAFVCFVISRICKVFIDNELESRATCVLDNMLLCELPQMWQAAMYIVGIILFTIVILLLAYRIAVAEYSPKAGKREVSPELLAFEKESPEQRHKRRIKITCIFGAVVIGIAAGVGYYFFGPSDEKPEYKEVAECLTDDSRLGPMVYGDEIYVPVKSDLEYFADGYALGYIGYKDQDCTSRFYRLAIANILYENPAKNDGNMLQMYGAEVNSYSKLSLIEESDNWKDDTVFLLWDEDWSQESIYSKDLTGYSEMEENLVKGLEIEFGQVEYDIKDFKDYDAYFTIIGYEDFNSALETESPKGDYVGCILVKDNKFYYGNYENRIMGVKLTALLDVLGGR